MKVLHNILGLIAAFALILVLLISSVELVVYGLPGFFEKEYTKYQVAAAVDMTMPDLLAMTDEMMAYLRGNRDDLIITTTVAGVEREFFNEREIHHMEDVRDLFIAGMKLRTICLVLIAVIVAVLVFLKARLSKVLPRMIQLGTALFFGVLLLLGFIISLNFTRAFNAFHEILFTNDLWILNPATDLLINIVPEPFFVDTALYIAFTFGLSMAVIFAVSTMITLKTKANRI